DVVSKAGSYLGGIIIPGPVTIANSLHKGTSQLPRVTIDFPDNVIGQSTDHAIQAGLSWGIIDMVDGLLNRLKLEIGGIVKVVSTGGLVDSFAKRSRLFGDVHQGLVLEGVRLIYKKWKEYSNAE
ncbi:type III pantothenate kinase, partial [bacterium]|nr:type III pantothenate kinase [bacterium]